MAFTKVDAQRSAASRLGADAATVTKSGMLNVARSVLERIGVDDLAVLVADQDNWRIGLRTPGDDDKPETCARVTPAGKSAARCTVNIRRALAALKVSAQKCAARYEVLEHGAGAGAVAYVVLAHSKNAIPQR